MSRMVRCEVLQDRRSYCFGFHFSLEGVFSLSALESKLVAYVNDADAQAEEFDASDVPRISKEQAKAESARK